MVGWQAYGFCWDVVGFLNDINHVHVPYIPRDDTKNKKPVEAVEACVLGMHVHDHVSVNAEKANKRKSSCDALDDLRKVYQYCFLCGDHRCGYFFAGEMASLFPNRNPDKSRSKFIYVDFFFLKISS